MFSDFEHLHFIDEADELEDCFESAMLEDSPVEDCFGNYGEEIAVWDGRGGGMHCCRRLVIKADYLVSNGSLASDLINELRDYIRGCPRVERVTIVGSQYSMKKLKVINGYDNCGRNNSFEGFIAGINVLKKQPVSVHCLTKRGAGPTCKVLRTSYI
tara:strand:- start:18 stop:488 length:471 start_codon:yes stop_codon:yes gene_type:complete